MKKTVILVAGAVLFLTACGNQTKNYSQNTTQASLPKGILQKDQEETKSFSIENQGATQTQTLTYKGKEFIRLVIQIDQPLSEDIKAQIDRLGNFEEAKQQLIENTQQSEDFKALAAISGVSQAVDLTEDYVSHVTLTFDVASLDLEALSKSDHYGYLADRIKKSTPENYILNLGLSGYKEKK